MSNDYVTMTDSEREVLGDRLLKNAYRLVEDMLVRNSVSDVGGMSMDEFIAMAAGYLDGWGEDGKELLVYPGLWMAYAIVLARMGTALNVNPDNVRDMADAMVDADEHEIMSTAAYRAADMFELFAGGIPTMSLSETFPWIMEDPDQWPKAVVPWCHSLTYTVMALLDQVTNQILENGILGYANRGG